MAVTFCGANLFKLLCSPHTDDIGQFCMTVNELLWCPDQSPAVWFGVWPAFVLVTSLELSIALRIKV